MHIVDAYCYRKIKHRIVLAWIGIFLTDLYLRSNSCFNTLRTKHNEIPTLYSVGIVCNISWAFSKLRLDWSNEFTASITKFFFSSSLSDFSCKVVAQLGSSLDFQTSRLTRPFVTLNFIATSLYEQCSTFTALMIFYCS